MSSEADDRELIYGCMRIAGDGSRDAVKHGQAALHAALDCGYRKFDHADIYGLGQCEAMFGDLLRQKPSLRDSIVLTSKCGVRFAGDPLPQSPKRYDLSKEHIVRSVEGSLDRLGTEALDTLLLHRPDYLFDEDAICEAFVSLYESGKVLTFGVSNFSVFQVSRLQRICPYHLKVHQIEISLEELSAFDNGTLDQCREMDMVPEAWSPLRGVTYSSPNSTLSDTGGARAHAELERQSRKFDCESWIVVIAWLLAHPARIEPIIGTLNPDRIRSARDALRLSYGREDWYGLLAARRGRDVA